MIRFANLAKQNELLRAEIEAAIGQVLGSGQYILGDAVARFERDFADYCGTEFTIGVNSGTSALHVALLAAGVGPGDEVITTPLTFLATATAITYTGARPVFADIDPETFTIDPARIEAAITARTRAIIPVHLYGHTADMDAILAIARRRQLAVIEDAAQAHGALYKGRRAGSLGDAGCFSFYPTKNLGACGEGGMVVTSRADWAARARSFRDWGCSEGTETQTRGYNYRMDGFQGAVLGIKLRHLERWNAVRRAHAELYRTCLDGETLRAPSTASWAEHVFHIFAVRAADRVAAQAAFAGRGVETRIHYAEPLHRMERFRDLGYAEGDFPHAERAAREVLSIPVHPELDDAEVDCVAAALRAVSLNPQAIVASRR